MNLITTDEPVARIERFQALQAGQYWRACEAVPEQGIAQGMVLLLQSVRWVDEKAHTIILRAHPSLYGQRVQLTYVDGAGTKRSRSYEYDEHRFLLDEFLARFEFAPDHEEVRASELAQAQARIAQLQQELVQTQRSPALLAQIVEEGLASAAVKDGAAEDHEEEEDYEDHDDADSAPDTREAPRVDEASHSPSSPQPGATTLPAAPLDAVAPSLGDGTIAGAIGTGITAEGIATLRAAAQREHQVATIKATWIATKTTAISNAIKALTPFYLEQAAAALALTEDVRTHVEKLLEGIASLDLYVGKDVEVHTIRKGASAPATEPLTIVQAKKVILVEACVYMDVDERFDFEDEHLFFEALRKHDDLVTQVFPTTRCILVMAATSRYIDYGDRFVNQARNQENKKTFCLIRDGDNIHRVFSPVESHLGAARLFPTKDEQEQVFRGWDGTQIRFEDVAYTDKLAQHERMALHFKRFLILACGLDHRLKLFGEFYPGPPTLEFVSIGFQNRYLRFLHDDEMLLPGTARPSVREWLKVKNAFLRPGSRVICNWFDVMNPSTAPGACKYDRSAHREFDFRYRPTARVSVVTAQKDGASICVDVEVSGYSYSTHQDRTFQCKVNLSKADGGRYTQGELSHLCLDAVEPEDLLWYIHNRGARQDHLTYIRFFKRALKHVQSERSIEAPTRARMLQALNDGALGVPEERVSIVSQAVMAWRAANRGKALPSDPSADVWASLLDQMFMLAGEGKSRMSEVEQLLLAQDLAPLRLVLSGNASLIAYAAPRAAELDDRLEPHAWVHRIALERGSHRYVIRNQRWALLARTAASETTIAEWPAAKEWAGRNTIFGSLERKQKIMAFAHGGLARLERLALLRATGHDALRRELTEAWLHARRYAQNQRKKHVVEPSLAVPVGLVRYPNTGELKFLCVCTHSPEALFADVQGGDASRSIRARYVQPYAEKAKIGSRFDKAVAKGASWLLATTELSHMGSSFGDFVHPMLEVDVETLAHPGLTNLLSDCFASWATEESRYSRTWLATNVVDGAGRLAVDAVLGIERPRGYAPTRVQCITIQSTSPDRSFHRWRDVSPLPSEAEGKNGHPGSARDKQVEMLIASVQIDHTGYNSYAQVFATPEEAYAYAAGEGEGAKDDDAVVWVRAQDLAGAPPAPAGYDRWYAVPGSSDAVPAA